MFMTDQLKKYGFEKLEVYQDARTYVKQLYIPTNKFPDREKFDIVSQLQRAGISVVSNIVKGTSRTSYKEKERFIEIAYGTYCQLQIVCDLNYIQPSDLDTIQLQIDKIVNKSSALKRSYSRNDKH